jgi:ubiquinone/menaquinone biosynthesis C-methylase UbiE
MGDIRVLLALARGSAAAKSAEDDHQAALEGFYGAQAGGYDDFRERLLHGREELLTRIPLAAGAKAAEIGGGTGRNLEVLGERIHRAATVEVVDLCRPLLEVAQQRCSRLGWSNVECVHGDATTYDGDGRGPLDTCWFAYSLTMIPDWRAAIDAAIDRLRPGGILGVVDFYVSHGAPPADQRRHSWFVRTFWRKWFSHDGVWLNPEHLDHLRSKLDTVFLGERSGRVPWLLGARAPYYVFLGRKR